MVDKSQYGRRLKGIDAPCMIHIRKPLRAFCNRFVCAVIMLVPLLLSPITAHASVNIPLDSPFYDDIDFLSAQGLVQSNLSSTRPITREEAGRLLAEAEYFSEMKKEVPSAATRLLNRMAENFDEEISEAKGQGRTPENYIKPLDQFSISYDYLDGPFSIFNNEGIDYFDGNNATVRFQSEARLWRVFSFYIEPLFLYNENAEGVEGNAESTFRLHKGYVKFTIDNFEIEWGKDSLWWGPGYHGALLISNNARPFEMYKISNPRATLLPWIFTYLGPFRYNVFISELDKEAASGHPPNSKLFGARVDFKPHPLFEFGISYLAHFGGDRPGIGGLDLSDYYHIILSNECRSFDKRDSNKQAAIDGALTIPGISDFVPLMDSLKLYAEWGGEDQSITPDKRAYLAGMLFNNVLTVPGLKLRAEYANLSPESVSGAWYTHAVWPMTHYGRVFGHHAGTDSDDLFLELSHNIKDRFFYMLSFDKERNGIHSTYTQERIQYFLEAGCKIEKWLNLSLRYGLEEISNTGNVKGVEEENSLIAAEVEFRF